MVQVTGTVHDVSDNPERVDRIIVRAVEPRVHGATYITEEPTQFPVVDGVLNFDVLPGPCAVAFLRPYGATTYEKLLVPDKTSAELVECIEAANLATEGTRSVLERLALEVQAELGQVPDLVSDALAQDSTIIDAVKQASVIREDTTVGTRVFAGGTMIFGDTGWRNVSSELTNVIESGKVFLRRRGDTIDIATEWAKLIPAGTSQMPTGFNPFRNVAVPFYASANLETPVARFRISFTGAITVNVFDDRYSANDMGTFATEDSWPTSLPGTPD